MAIRWTRLFRSMPDRLELYVVELSSLGYIMVWSMAGGWCSIWYEETIGM